MSRSYKKHPFCTDHHVKTTKEKKRFANKKIRHTKNIPNGRAFRKIYETYDICDWKNRWTWEEALADWNSNKTSYLNTHYLTLKNFYRYWLKCCRMK